MELIIIKKIKTRQAKKSMSLIYVGIYLSLVLLYLLFPPSSTDVSSTSQFSFQSNPFLFLFYGAIVLINHLFKMHAFKDKVTQKLSHLFANNSPTSSSSSSHQVIFSILFIICICLFLLLLLISNYWKKN